ncbi:MAG TPA: HAMP domain-containing sensor histidine kinase [Chloroflexia bacterium]|nr:HAMP domain-containing sensor histidine kinase [Chloroflexia bacterium]
MMPAEGDQANLAATNQSHRPNEDLLRDLFFSYIFHELRTPLTVIHSYAQILQSRLPATSEFSSQRHVSEQIVLQGDEVVEMIEELLEAGRIPIGRLNLDLVEYDLVELIDGLLERLPPEERERVHWQAPGEYIPVMAEGPRLERAILAVLRFALQVTGEVNFTATLDKTNHTVTLTVPTPGWNISPAEVEVLFDLYRPVRREEPMQMDTPKAGPLDISLFVAHGLIEGHKGRLIFDLKMPAFVVQLPVAAEAA